MHEAVGNMHMHTPYSDGEKWHKEVADDAIRAGLDFVIVTDHNVWVHGVEGYYENDEGRVLLLTGEEVHDVR
ncbi:MAG TPA: PHP domain-containing protein, partial [Candidatus Binatia bacterium]|nr:PHP domain-containing protein [Candidatus Binatia bacterium]